MKEIEVKAKLRNRQGVIEQLTRLGCAFTEPVAQRDTVYAEKLGSLETFRSNRLFLRLRTVNGSKTLLTLKQPKSNSLDKLEYETEVASAEEEENMLTLMGYQRGVVVSKTRITTHYQGYEICIDEVAGLGSFIEMEKLTEAGAAEEIQNEMFAFLVSLGITPEDRVNLGYDLLLMQENQEHA